MDLPGSLSDSPTEKRLAPGDRFAWPKEEAKAIALCAPDQEEVRLESICCVVQVPAFCLFEFLILSLL
jgi:hypothetical protein